ncbi:SRPBCC family protein [Nocardia sp. NPDC051570]|uniref:SRPBCC family protein n=1 Tax=Nocardia sp. NPDC051570 TaxID=3364324 RepID=UPI0037BB237A
MASSTRVDVEFRVRAGPEVVMAALTDLRRLPEWSALHRNVRIESTDDQGRPIRVALDATFGPIVDRELIEYGWDGIERVNWNVLRSTYLTIQRGSYTLRPDPDGTQVTMALEIEAKFLAPKLMVRGLQLATSKTASKRFKAFAESYAI